MAPRKPPTRIGRATKITETAPYNQSALSAMPTSGDEGEMGLTQHKFDRRKAPRADEETRREIAARNRKIKDDLRVMGLDPTATSAPEPSLRSNGKRRSTEEIGASGSKRHQPPSRENKLRVKGIGNSSKSANAVADVGKRSDDGDEAANRERDETEPAMDDGTRRSYRGTESHATKEGQICVADAKQQQHGVLPGTDDEEAESLLVAGWEEPRPAPLATEPQRSRPAQHIPETFEIQRGAPLKAGPSQSAVAKENAAVQPNETSNTSKKHVQNALLVKIAEMDDSEALLKFSGGIVKKYQVHHAKTQSASSEILHQLSLVFLAAAESHHAASLTDASTTLGGIERAACYHVAFTAIDALEKRIASVQDLPRLRKNVTKEVELSKDHQDKMTNTKPHVVLKHEARHYSLLLLMAMLEERESVENEIISGET